MNNLDDKLKALAARIEKQRDSVQTEEACKTAFVMPFLQALGYDVFDPHVVVPEFTADVGVKKGEKADYAIRINGKVAILIECKGCGTNLAQTHMNQLFRYFTVTEARFAVLTNGIEYWFYSDLDERNKMDQRPFFIFNVTDRRLGDINELQKFTSEAFDLDAILSTASNLKYSSAIKAELLKEFESPSEDMIKLLVSRVFDGNITQKVKADFAPLVAAAFEEAIRDRVSDRLVSALGVTTGAVPNIPAPLAGTLPAIVVDTPESAEDIITTEEELEAFHIVRAIVRPEIKSDRVVMRDAKSYCAVLIDDNNRKPLARFHFNSKSVRYLSVFDKDKSEDKVRIDSLDDIYQYADRLRATAAAYHGAKATA